MGKIAGGFVFQSPVTDERTTDVNKVLGWVMNGQSPVVCGYFGYQWIDSSLCEVWHCIDGDVVQCQNLNAG